MGKQRPSNPLLKVDEDGFRPFRKGFRKPTVPGSIRGEQQDQLLGTGVMDSDQQEEVVHETVAVVHNSVSVHEQEAISVSVRV